jgi:hypothetical protein
MWHVVQRLGFGFLCLFAWTMVVQEGSAALSGSAEFSSSQRFVVLLDGAAITDVQTDRLHLGAITGFLLWRLD